MDAELQFDIEQTLDQLVDLAAMIKKARASHGFDHELEALEKMQDSLLARLLHRQALLEMGARGKRPRAIRKEEITCKALDCAHVFHQKAARSKRACSKS